MKTDRKVFMLFIYLHTHLPLEVFFFYRVSPKKAIYSFSNSNLRVNSNNLLYSISKDAVSYDYKLFLSSMCIKLCVFTDQWFLRIRGSKAIINF